LVFDGVFLVDFRVCLRGALRDTGRREALERLAAGMGGPVADAI
jgi:hypothetical protein